MATLTGLLLSAVVDYLSAGLSCAADLHYSKAGILLSASLSNLSRVCTAKYGADVALPTPSEEEDGSLCFFYVFFIQYYALLAY